MNLIKRILFCNYHVEILNTFISLCYSVKVAERPIHVLKYAIQFYCQPITISPFSSQDDKTI